MTVAQLLPGPVNPGRAVIMTRMGRDPGRAVIMTRPGKAVIMTRMQ